MKPLTSHTHSSGDNVSTDKPQTAGLTLLLYQVPQFSSSTNQCVLTAFLNNTPHKSVVPDYGLQGEPFMGPKNHDEALMSCEVASPDGVCPFLLPSGLGGLDHPPSTCPIIHSFLAAGKLKPLLLRCLIICTHLSVYSEHTHTVFKHIMCLPGGSVRLGADSGEMGKMEPVKYRQFCFSVFFLLGTKPEEVNNWPQIENTLLPVGRHLGYLKTTTEARRGREWKMRRQEE